RDVRAAGLQPRLEPRPHRRRRGRRPRASARRTALGRRHELHARARRREGAAGASRRNAAETCGGLATGRLSGVSACVPRLVAGVIAVTAAGATVASAHVGPTPGEVYRVWLDGRRIDLSRSAAADTL